MKKWWIFCAVLLAILSGSLIYYYTFHFHPESEAAPRTAGPEQAIYPLQSEQKDKKIIMFILDSMTAPLIDSALEKGTMPALQFLIDHGQYYPELVCPFPTMSVTIESTLLTGKMADGHAIPGLSWYAPDEDRLVDYGTTIRFWLKNGLRQGLSDTLYRLNNAHLNPETPTLFEELARHGKTSGAVNMIVHRGSSPHQLQWPKLMQALVGLPEDVKIQGPEILAFGRFIKPEAIKESNLPDSLGQRVGLNDRYTAQIVRQLITQGKQPDFLLAYFPDFDKTAHRHGPHYRKGFERVDRYLQEILNSFDSWEQALEDLLGDHGQDQLVAGEEQAGIDLEKLYADYDIHRLGDPVSESAIAFGVNGRMSYVYDVHNSEQPSRLAELALQDERIALAAWLEKDWVVTQRPGSNQVFRFSPGGPLTDIYGQRWTLQSYILYLFGLDDERPG